MPPKPLHSKQALPEAWLRFEHFPHENRAWKCIRVFAHARYTEAKLLLIGCVEYQPEGKQAGFRLCEKESAIFGPYCSRADMQGAIRALVCKAGYAAPNNTVIAKVLKDAK